MQIQSKDYWKLFKPSACSIRLKGETKAEVFEEMLTNLVRAKLLPAALTDAAGKALLERERIASTGIGKSVAIPHVKLSGIEEVVVSLSIHLEGVDWNSLDGEPVRVFFVVLRPEGPGVRHDPARHLEMMRWISTLAHDQDFRNFARAAKTRTELVELLKEMADLSA